MTQLGLRASILLSSSVVLACARAAEAEAGAGVSGTQALEIAVIALAVLSAAFPDSHFGLALMILLGANWLVAVDDHNTIWLLLAAASVAVLHMSMAAASVAPFRAGWTPAMRRRWLRRCVWLVASAAPAWLISSLLSQLSIGSSALLVTAALLSAIAAVLWATDNLPRHHP